MEVLEKVRQWVTGFPQWEEGNLLYIDFMGAVPGSSGLYPGGMEVVSAKADVVGGVKMTCRYHFFLYRVGNAEGDGRDAAWLLAFQNWVLAQCAQGLAPRFGDDPGAEKIFAEKGQLKDASCPGSGVYGVKLTAQFVRKF